MIKFIPVDLSIHKSVLLDLTDEYLSWIAEEIKNHYELDAISILRQPIRNYAESTVEEFISYKPPNGIYYLLQIKDKIVGMGALRKLNDSTGELKRMYVRPEFRGNGFGKTLLKKLLAIGKKFGCSRILLDTGQFMTAAQHLYRSAGFKDTNKYPETEVPTEMQPYWLYMEIFL
jgi:ribosomal protein S18 acetylase RimI-like enzyme